MRFLVVCGGSAGHINPAIAIAEEMRKQSPQSDILFAGAGKILENRLVPEAGFDIVNIKMSGVRRGFSLRDILHNIKTVKNLLIAGYKANKLLKRQKPDAVIGTGGYGCYPILKKAAKKGIASYVLEPNAHPGLAVRMLSSFVDRIFVTYTGQEKIYKFPERVTYTGTPLVSKFGQFDRKSVEEQRRILSPDGKPLVISYWGSIGAVGMNKKILSFIKRNYDEKKFNHIHATGVGSSVKVMTEELIKMGVAEVKAPLTDIREYISDMPLVMRAADLVLARSGASTIAELTATEKPAVLIPSPNVTENHQEENARQLQNTGSAVMILENDCTGDSLFDTAVSILDDKDCLEKMTNALKTSSEHKAAAKIVEIILDDNKKALNRKH